MILGFKDQFEAPIMAGTKIHTIREDPRRRWEKGKIIHFSVRVRQPDMRVFWESICTGVEPIEIRPNWNGKYTVYVGQKRLVTQHQIVNLARNDGFNSRGEFEDWFNEPFKGWLIHWTKYRYDRKHR